MRNHSGLCNLLTECNEALNLLSGGVAFVVKDSNIFNEPIPWLALLGDYLGKKFVPMVMVFHTLQAVDTESLAFLRAIEDALVPSALGALLNIAV